MVVGACPSPSFLFKSVTRVALSSYHFFASPRTASAAMQRNQDDRLWLLRSKSEQAGRRRGGGRSHSFSLSLVPCVARTVSRPTVSRVMVMLWLRYGYVMLCYVMPGGAWGGVAT